MQSVLLLTLAATACISGLMIPYGDLPKQIKISNHAVPKEYLGNDNINISIIKRDEFTPQESQLFKTLYFRNQLTSFSFDQDGDISEDCYDDRLPVNIIIHKGSKAKETDREFVDQLREMDRGKKSYNPFTSYGVIEEDSLFNYDKETTSEEEAIEIQTLRHKIGKNSIASFLDKFNDLIYVINGTQFDLNV